MAVNSGGARGLLQVVSDLNVQPSIGGRGALTNIPSSGVAEAHATRANSFNAIAADFDGLAAKIGSYADHAAGVEGAREGALAGMDPEFRPTRNLTIRDEAFDRAGLQTYGARVRLGVENDIEEGGDLEAKRSAWLREVPDELKPDVDWQFRRGMFARARQEAREALASERAAAAQTLQDELDMQVKSLHQRAYVMGLDPQSSAVLARDVAEVERQLSRTGPDGKPVLGRAEIKKILKGVRETVVDARLYGAFDRLETPEQQKAFIERFEADWTGTGGPASDVNSVLSDQQKTQLDGVAGDVVGRFAALQGATGITFKINSGYRDTEHNARVGGAKSSQHIDGNAIDIDVSGLSKQERVEVIRKASELGFTGLGVYDNALHLDAGARRAWGPSHHGDSVPAWARGAVDEHLQRSGQGVAAEYDMTGFERVRGHLNNALRASLSQRRQIASAALEDIKRFEMWAEDGHAPTADQMAGLKVRALATGDPEVLSRVGQIEDVAAFQNSIRRLPPEVIDQYAVNLRNEIRAKGPNEIATGRLKMAEALADKARTELKQDPLTWAAKTGAVNVAPLDLSSADGFAKSLRGRVVQAEEVGSIYGQAPVYLTPAEKADVAQLMASSGGELDVFKAVTAGGAGRASRIFKELRKDYPTVAGLGDHVATIGATQFAQDAAAGLALSRLPDFKPIANSPLQSRTLAVGVHGGALNAMPQVEQSTIAVANAAYEIRARRAGVTDVAVDEDRWKQVFREALGERIIDGVAFGGIVEHKGGSVLLPPDVRQDAFDDVVGAVAMDDFGGNPPHTAAGPASLRDIRNARLISIGAGRYALDVGSADMPMLLVDREGKRFTLDIAALKPLLRLRVPDAYIEGPRAAEATATGEVAP